MTSYVVRMTGLEPIHRYFNFPKNAQNPASLRCRVLAGRSAIASLLAQASRVRMTGLEPALRYVVSQPMLRKQVIKFSEWAQKSTRKKVVATACRCERVYKRTGKPSVAFW